MSGGFVFFVSIFYMVLLAIVSFSTAGEEIAKWNYLERLQMDEVLRQDVAKHNTHTEELCTKTLHINACWVTYISNLGSPPPPKMRALQLSPEDCERVQTREFMCYAPVDPDDKFARLDNPNKYTTAVEFNMTPALKEGLEYAMAVTWVVRTGACCVFFATAVLFLIYLSAPGIASTPTHTDDYSKPPISPPPAGGGEGIQSISVRGDARHIKRHPDQTDLKEI